MAIAFSLVSKPDRLTGAETRFSRAHAYTAR
jgi:hypothetical protein